MIFFVIKLVGLVINVEVYMKKDFNLVNKMICNFGVIFKYKKLKVVNFVIIDVLIF